MTGMSGFLLVNYKTTCSWKKVVLVGNDNGDDDDYNNNNNNNYESVGGSYWEHYQNISWY